MTERDERPPETIRASELHRRWVLFVRRGEHGEVVIWRERLHEALGRRLAGDLPGMEIFLPDATPDRIPVKWLHPQLEDDLEFFRPEAAMVLERSERAARD
jgi:hypothetical protein